MLEAGPTCLVTREAMLLLAEKGIPPGEAQHAVIAAKILNAGTGDSP